MCRSIGDGEPERLKVQDLEHPRSASQYSPRKFQSHGVAYPIELLSLNVIRCDPDASSFHQSIQFLSNWHVNETISTALLSV